MGCPDVVFACLRMMIVDSKLKYGRIRTIEPRSPRYCLISTIRQTGWVDSCDYGRSGTLVSGLSRYLHIMIVVDTMLDSKLEYVPWDTNHYTITDRCWTSYRRHQSSNHDCSCFSPMGVAVGRCFPNVRASIFVASLWVLI